MMKKFNWFCGFGRVFFGMGLFYIWKLWKAYGSGVPSNAGQWIGEFMVGFLLVAAAAFYATGKHLERRG